MIALDQVLPILCYPTHSLDDLVPNKDKRILLSFFNQLDQGNFLTENQGKLLIKILNENKKSVSTKIPDLQVIINGGRWSQPFRVIHKVRRIFISNQEPECITVEFTYDKRLKHKINEFSKKVNNQVTISGSKYYTLPLTELNIFHLVNEFNNDDFDVDQKIMDFYHEIAKIVKNAEMPFSVFDLQDKNLEKIIENDIGPITAENLVLLHDRKFRYQYQISEKIPEISLKNAIAQRSSPTVWIDPTSNTLDDVIGAIKDLQRLPLMIIFEGHDPKINKKMLDFLVKSLSVHGLTDQVGIYFRFDKQTDSTGFNATIADLHLNKNLSDETKIVGISNGKLPKFIMKNTWHPMSVISFTHAFRNNRSYVYCNDVDLIVYYTDKQPLNGTVDAIV